MTKFVALVVYALKFAIGPLPVDVSSQRDLDLSIDDGARAWRIFGLALEE